MLCKKCKNEIPDNAIFCQWCGTRQIKERKKKEAIKVPKPRQLASGSWFIQMRLGGVSVPVNAHSEADCIRLATAIKTEYMSGKRKFTPALDMTLCEAIESYINSKSNVLSPSTLRGYKIIKKHRFDKHMGTKLKEIRDWQSIVNEEASLVSAKTVANAWGLVAATLHFHNIPFDEPSLPMVPRNERPWLDYEQIEIFIKAIRGNKYELPALLALSSFRCSEILGLRLDNVDFKNECITIRETIVLNSENKLVVKPTAKNSSSQRVVPILIPRLLRLLELVPQDTDFIVTCRENILFVNINKVCSDAGLPLVGVHGLRHSFASLCYHLNIPEEMCMRYGGWSNPGVLRRIYTHLSGQDKQKWDESIRAFYADIDTKAGT